MWIHAPFKYWGSYVVAHSWNTLSLKFQQVKINPRKNTVFRMKKGIQELKRYTNLFLEQRCAPWGPEFNFRRLSLNPWQCVPIESSLRRHCLLLFLKKRETTQTHTHAHRCLKVKSNVYRAQHRDEQAELLERALGYRFLNGLIGR